MSSKRMAITKLFSPRVAQNKKPGTCPTSPYKADTGDLSRFVSGISGDMKGVAELLCYTFVYNIFIRFLWSV